MQPGHRGQMSAGHLGSCPTRSPNLGRSALFSWAVLGLRLGHWQGGLSRGHSVVVESGAWSAPGLSVAMTTHRPGLGPGLPVFPCESFMGPRGLNS